MTDLRPIRAWRVYYSPTSWVCSSSGIEPANLEDEIQVVVTWETRDCGRGLPYSRRLSGSDWYWWSGEYCGTLSDFVQPDSHNYPPGHWLSPQPILDRFPDAVLKKGTWLEDDLYERTYRAALRAVPGPG